jgi:glyoxylase-like metal-dependent hydrolase (beta-lactamase superfamily II)
MSWASLSEHVYRYDDTCNVYVLTSGDRALLIDLGAGGVLDELDTIGVNHVDWLLHTHHHRDQCSGHARLAVDTRVGVPASEEHAFADVERFWQTAPVYDLYDCAGIHNVVARDVRVDRALDDREVLEWEGLRLETLPTPGHTRGSVSYLVEVDGLLYAFSGDLIHSSGRVWTVHDLSWWYGGAEGYRCAAESAATLRRRAPDRLGPSHGPVLEDSDAALRELELNLRAHIRCIDPPRSAHTLGDDVGCGRFDQIGDRLVAVTHTCANFYVLLGDGGDALFFDYGFGGEHHFKANFRFVEHSLDVLRERFGMERPAVVVPTHYHDDHVAGIGFLQERFGTEVWAFEGFADLLERPWAYRIPCLWPRPLRVSRRIREGETITWNGIELTCRHAPGHTWYAAAYLGEIDGRRVAFAGDAVARDADGRLWGGGPVYRNRLGRDDFAATAELLLAYGPELLLTGHRGVVEVSPEDLVRFAAWAREFSDTLGSLLADPAGAGFQLDPDLVTCLPYQLTGVAGEPLEVGVEVRNPLPEAADALVRLVVPDGWSADPDAERVRIGPGSCGRVGFSVQPLPDAVRGVRHVAFAEVTLGPHRLGLAAEALIVLSERNVLPDVLVGDLRPSDTLRL